jgi:hypothetical protein
MIACVRILLHNGGEIVLVASKRSPRFAGHTSSSCPKGFPDGTSYKTLTASAVLAKKSKKKEVVAAVDVDEDAETVAVVMASAVLGNGTNSGEECVAPLQTPHLCWECLVNRLAVSSPLTVSALIDHGSSLVLIGEDLVKQLGLHHRKLAKSIPISLALSQDKDSFLFMHYIKLSCTSLDNVYTSQMYAPLLHLIFVLPFCWEACFCNIIKLLSITSCILALLKKLTMTCCSH